MSKQSVRKWTSKYAPVAFVFGACFIVPGSGVAFSIVQGIALTHATASSERALEWVKRKIGGEHEEINHDLQKAMLRGYEHAIDHLATSWKESIGKAKHDREKNDLAAELFKILKEDAAAILSKERIAEFAGSAEAVQSIGSGSGVAQFLEPYLYGHDEHLRAFLLRSLEPAIGLFFGEELKTDTRAWRAFQRLVTDSMIAGFGRVEAGQEQLREADREILARLEALATRFDELPEEIVDRTGWDGLDRAIESARDQVVSIVVEEGERTRRAIAESERNLGRRLSEQLEVTEARFDEIQRLIGAAATRVEVVVTAAPSAVPGATAPAVDDIAAAHKLLELVSFFAPEEIPLDLIIARAGWLPGDLRRALTNPDLSVLDALAREADEPVAISAQGGLTIPEHLLADVRSRLDPARARQLAELAVRLAASWLPERFDDPVVWPVYRRVEAHALAATDRALTRNVAVSQSVAIERRIAGFSMSYGDYVQARRLRERLLAVARAEPGASNLRIAAASDDLARAQIACGEFALARDLLEQSLAIQRESLSATDPAIAGPLNDLAGIDLVMGALEPANERLQEALTRCRGGLPANDPLTASVLGNLARLRLLQKENEQAKSLAEETLAMRRRVFPPDHPEIAAGIVTLAHALEPFPESHRRMKLYEEALDLRRQVLPPDHPDIASSLYDLAEMHGKAWQGDRAQELREEALAMRQRSLPAGHLQIAQSMSALATSLTVEDPSRAMQLYADSLDIYRAVLPAGHATISETQMSAMVLTGVRLVSGAAKWAWKKLKRPRVVHEDVEDRPGEE